MDSNRALAAAITELTGFLRESRGLATKDDLRLAESRIVAAIKRGGGTPDTALAGVTADLKASADPLKESVAANQPQ